MGVAMAPLALAAGIGGAALQADASYQSSMAKSAQAAYQAQVAQNNATIAQQDARLDIQAGETAATNQGLKTRAAVGQQKAAQGASGIDVNSGSAVDVRVGTESIGMLDALTLRSNAAKAAYAKEVEANSDTAQGQLLQSESQQEADAAPLGAFGTLLSGASSVGGNWGKFQSLYGSTGGGSSGVANFNSGNPIY
jgi:hypothetical protein